MRIFVPATSADLSLPTPPTGVCFTAVTAPGASSEEVEVAEFAAQTEAAVASLELLQDAEFSADSGRSTLAKRRLVLAGDTSAVLGVSDPDTQVSQATVQSWTWEDVVALLVDGPSAEAAVNEVVNARSQEQADQALNDLWEYALEWFDVSERTTLIADLAAD